MRIPGERRFDQASGRTLIALGAQEIGEIDQRLQAGGFDRQNTAEKRLCRLRKPQRLCRLAQRKQNSRVVRPFRKSVLEFADGFGMARLRKEEKTLLVRIASRGSHV